MIYRAYTIDATRCNILLHQMSWSNYCCNWYNIQIIFQHSPMKPNSICPCDPDSTHSICWMKGVVCVFTDPHGLIWPMIVNMQKRFTICNFLIQDRSVPCSCSTVPGGLCIFMIMISCIGDQTLVNCQLYYIYYYYDILTKPRIE